MSRYQTAVILQLLAPLSWGLGLWLVFPSIHIAGSGCLTCFAQLGVTVDTSPGALVPNGIGSVFIVVGLLFFVSSLGMFASKNSARAARWLVWMGRWRPRWADQTQETMPAGKYRILALASLAGALLVAVLVIPGIGEDRQFPLDQFFTLWGTLWYFYVFAIGVIGWILIYKRVVGGYFLSAILSLISIGMVVPDLLGLLPPAPPTLKTSIIFVSGLPFSILCTYVSLRTIQLSRAYRS